jgi:Protein of unknown function (DUF664)
VNTQEHELFFISEIKGLTPEIGRLISMMDYTRHTTMCEIKGLSQEELDYHFDENSNSIGMLLYHMASLEKAFQIITFEARDLTDEEWEELSVGIVLGEDAKQEIRGKDLAF